MIFTIPTFRQQLLDQVSRSDPNLIQLEYRRQCFSSSHRRELVDALRANSILTCLDLSSNDFRDRTIFRMNFQHLITLNLSDNSITDHGIAILCADLKLVDLNLGRNRFGPKGVATLATTLSTNTTLISLNLRENNLQDEGMHALAAGFRGNTTLDRLILTNNGIGPDGARSLSTVLRQNQLTHLDLGFNRILKDGAEEVMTAITTSLTYLSLSQNRFSGVGEVIGTTLSTNSTLQTLCLGLNHLHSRDFISIARGLSLNSTLTCLSLANNRFVELDTSMVVNYLASNIGLNFLSVRECGLDATTCVDLCSILSYQTRLETIDLDQDSVFRSAGHLDTILKDNPTILQIPPYQHFHLERNRWNRDRRRDSLFDLLLQKI